MPDKTSWPAAVRPRAMSMGILLSLLLHIGLMQLYWHQEAAGIAPPDSSRTETTLLLLPAALITRTIMPLAVQRDSRPVKSPVRANTTRLILSPAPSKNNVNNAVITPQAADQQPHVDLDAALKTARKIAIDPDERRNGTAVGQLQTHPLEARPDSRLARDIQHSARADCKDIGQPFGLFAPLVLAADAVLSKKDGGCKW